MEEDHETSSSSSTEMVDTSSSSSSSSSLSTSLQSRGALDDLSELMSHLPIKRGLSKFYQGKTQSFTSLSRVTSLEDLAKKSGRYGRRIKACNSYHQQRLPFIAPPKATISKKSTSSSSSCLRAKITKRIGFLTIHRCKSPLSCVET